MARGANVDIQILQGATFRKVFRWAAEPTIFKPITALSATPPATFTVPAHGIPQNWPCAIVSAPWAKTINVPTEPPSAADYLTARVVDQNTITFDGINSTGWTFKTGGFIRYFSPISLLGFSARMQIKDKIGGTTLLSLSSTEGSLVVDDQTKMIILTIDPSATNTATWDRGVYDLELVGASGVYEIAYGRVTLAKQVTTE